MFLKLSIAKNFDLQVFSSKSRPELSLDPPSPETSQPPTRRLSEGWNEYDTTDGRKYFYNLQTKEKRWKPPRRNQLADVSFILFIIIIKCIFYVFKSVIGLKRGSFCKCMTFWATGPDYILNGG